MRFNILKNPQRRKPEKKKEYSRVQNEISKENNIQELTLKQLAYYVGEQGYFWKTSLMIGGSKNENFKAAYILALDFDDGYKIEEFLTKSQDLGLEPNFVYKTFSYTDEFHKFRAVWKLRTPIEDPQVRNIFQLMLMEVFPEHDSACKEVSRLWNGGKGVVNFKEHNELNIDNLVNAVTTVIRERDKKKFDKNIKAFCKKLGLYTINNLPAVLNEKVVKSGENHVKSYNIYNIEDYAENATFEVFFKEYDNYKIYLDVKSYNHNTNNSRGAKVQNIKTNKKKKVKIDWDKLQKRCYLYSDFVAGQKLEHGQIYHLSTNLYVFEKYPTILGETLKKYNYNNWENKYNTYVAAMNYNYQPSRCETKCQYYQNCNGPLNIKSRYYEKECKVQTLKERVTKPLESNLELFRGIYERSKEGDKKMIKFIKAPTGIGKSKMLETLDLSDTIVAVSNHRLGEQLYHDLLRNPNNCGLVYARPLNMDRLPEELRKKISKYYELGLHGEVKNEIFEEIKKLNKLGLEGHKHPKYYEDLKAYLDNLEAVQNAKSLLYTHHRMAFGTNNHNIKTIIIDEDFLKAFIKHDFKNAELIFDDLRTIRNWLEKFNNKKYKFYQDYLDFYGLTVMFDMELQSNKGEWIPNPLKELLIDARFRKLLVDFIKENANSMNTQLFRLINAEYVQLTENGFITYVNGEDIKILGEFNVIVQSATLDEKIHTAFIKRYLPDKEIEFIDLGDIEFKGNLYCDCRYSFSRYTLTNQSEKAKKKIEEILTSDKYENVITFMNDELIDVEKYGKKKIAYYGATEGLNGYEGQNLCIIGTPHTNSTLYDAYGVLLTGHGPVSRHWERKRVRTEYHEFDLHTYASEEDQVFTDIQMYMLYSELIQAVGRARQLRYECNVYVYSSLPLPGCKLI